MADVVAVLAARYRATAAEQPGAAAVTRAATVTACAQLLEEASLIAAEFPVAGEPARCTGPCPPAFMVCYTARLASANWQCLPDPDKVTGPVAAALSALAEGTAKLASSAADPQVPALSGVRVRLDAAAERLSDGLS
jgi:hypothetical protein